MSLSSFSKSKYSLGVASHYKEIKFKGGKLQVEMEESFHMSHDEQSKITTISFLKVVLKCDFQLLYALQNCLLVCY